MLFIIVPKTGVVMDQRATERGLEGTGNIPEATARAHSPGKNLHSPLKEEWTSTPVKCYEIMRQRTTPDPESASRKRQWVFSTPIKCYKFIRLNPPAGLH